MSLCPCGLPVPYEECCGQLHTGTPAPTAERLMRSRYTAFVKGDAAYLLRTWDPTTRPKRVAIDKDIVWRGLRVVATTGGGLLDSTGTVEYRASYELEGKRDAMQENGQFRRHEGAWVYRGP